MGFWCGDERWKSDAQFVFERLLTYLHRKPPLRLLNQESRINGILDCLEICPGLRQPTLEVIL